MEYMTTAEIREKYLKFFEEKGCKRMPSSSLIPDDPSLLLTAAGMVQFKPYFLQQKHLEAPYIGTTTVQKCVRTNDIDIIGTTGRHLSFFEMLGNFSFGEYFKKEMCAWALEFSTEVLGLPLERLYFTVFEDDDETIEIWQDLGIDPSHISKLGEDDNFWRAGPTGPCGPCSELYFDQGPEVGCGSLIALRVAIAIASSSIGIASSHNMMHKKMARSCLCPRRTSILEWVLSASLPSCRVWTTTMTRISCAI